MKIALTGASGFVGRFILRAALAQGHSVTVLGRHRPPDLPAAAGFVPWSLGEPAPLHGHDTLIHAAFSHVPGRYRGGEGDDPAGFLRRNGDGSQRLFEDAAGAGLRRALFLSSRAVFDGYPPGTRLTETLPPQPKSLYGTVKLQTEQALADLSTPDFRPIILRATGVYGPVPGGGPHKWSDLFAQFLTGQSVAPRIATEVHGDDLARAVLILLDHVTSAQHQPQQANDHANHDPADPATKIAATDSNAEGTILAHASDILLDRHDLLAAVAQLAGMSAHPHLPARLDPASVSCLDCATLARLGWRPGGMALLHRTLPSLLA